MSTKDDQPSMDTQPKKYNDQQQGHFSLVRNFYIADVITLMNGVCGVMSVFASMRYLLTSDIHDLYSALGFMPFGLFFDFFDGRVARWRKNSSILGQELDSLADLISFGVAPAALAFAVGMRTYLDTVVLTYFVCCGIARLARFNATVASQPKDTTGKISHFEGTPIPTSLTLVAILAYFVSQGRFLDALPGQLIQLAPTWDLHPLVFMYALSGTLMVSKTLRIPKP
ncbi:phosphatidylserine synthase [Lichtheimia corymbifera JMRC:FSU:9682]|uniref:CDP-diacylglycerol--serine O-phosphatidyltransferase n=1 Tax=Lichtheimia corymbifera JMRC:FSU:9682 TaxID=1263082 RepID=A0A068RIF6_9FUNG|nr:phosphatidylserine synthase [Lichtheimia corymbifera JMRC:FSU:9682]